MAETTAKGFFQTATGMAIGAASLFVVVFVAAYAWNKGSKTAAK